MKASPTTIESLSDMTAVETKGDLRRIVANSLLALARKEISATDVEAMARGLDAISNSVNVEIKVARTRVELREKGASLGDVALLGQLLIGGDAGKTNAR